jgi:hypothetical protein
MLIYFNIPVFFCLFCLFKSALPTLSLKSQLHYEGLNKILLNILEFQRTLSASSIKTSVIHIPKHEQASHLDEWI